MSKEALDQFHTVVQTERHSGAAAELESRRQPSGPPLQFGPAHPTPVIDERELLAVP